MSRIILDSPIPASLMRRPLPGPLAKRRSTSEKLGPWLPLGTTNGTRDVLQVPPSPPMRKAAPRRYPTYPLLDWEPRFRWRDVLGPLLVLGWMLGLTWYVDHLEREQMARIGDCPTSAVARTP